MTQLRRFLGLRIAPVLDLGVRSKTKTVFADRSAFLDVERRLRGAILLVDGELLQLDVLRHAAAFDRHLACRPAGANERDRQLDLASRRGRDVRCRGKKGLGLVSADAENDRSSDPGAVRGPDARSAEGGSPQLDVAHLGLADDAYRAGPTLGLGCGSQLDRGAILSSRDGCRLLRDAVGQALAEQLDGTFEAVAAQGVDLDPVGAAGAQEGTVAASGVLLLIRRRKAGGRHQREVGSRPAQGETPDVARVGGRGAEEISYLHAVDTVRRGGQGPGRVVRRGVEIVAGNAAGAVVLVGDLLDGLLSFLVDADLVDREDRVGREA